MHILILSLAILWLSWTLLSVSERFYFNAQDDHHWDKIPNSFGPPVLSLDDVPQLHTMQEAVNNDTWNYDTLANLKMSTQYKTWIKNIN